MNTQATLVIDSIIDKETGIIRIGQFNETIETTPAFEDMTINHILSAATLDSGDYEIEINIKKKI